MTKVLALDPGYDRLGVAVLQGTGSKPELVYSTCIGTTPSLPFPERLHELGSAFLKVLTAHKPTIVALETLFFNKNVKTAIHVAEARGMLVYLAKEHGCTILEFSPQEIKVAVTGYGKSDKTAMTQMVRRLVPNTPARGHDDEFDAIATGITALAHLR